MSRGGESISTAHRRASEAALAPVRARNAELPARVLAAGDAVALAVALAVSFSWAGALFAIAAWIGLGFTSRGGERFTRSLLQRTPSILGRIGIAALAALPVAAWWDSVRPLVRVALVAVVLIPAMRLIAHMVVARLRRERAVVEPTLIVGASLAGIDIAEILLRDPGYGLSPIGFLEDRPAGADIPVPIVGHPADLPGIASDLGVRRAIVAFPTVDDARLVSVARAASEVGVDLYVIPRLFELGLDEASDQIVGYPLVLLRASSLAVAVPRAKRVFDLSIATVVLILSSPLMAAAALAIRVFDGPPVLLRQKRVGRNGVPFELLKFRTMAVNDDADTTWSVARDDRVTAVGRILRASSLDELPQLFNVVRGEMSLVGPRPERPYFVEEFRTKIPRYDDRHRVPGGITGLAQVHGLRGDTSIRHRVRLDNAYIDHWSVWSDATIVIRTFLQMIRDAANRVVHSAPRSADERGVVAAPDLARARRDETGYVDEERA